MGAWIIREKAKPGMKIVAVRQLVCAGLWNLVMIFVGYGSKDNRLTI